MASKKRTALLPEEMSPRDVLRATWAALLVLQLNGPPAKTRAPKRKKLLRPVADLNTLVAQRLPVAAAAAAPRSRRPAAPRPTPPRSWYWRY